MRDVIFYRSAKGDEPVREFLDSLNSKNAQKIIWVLALVENMRIVPKQYFKKLVGTEDICEVRIDSANDTFRLLGFFDSGNLIILTNGFTKKTERTPKNEIRIAEERKRDYLSRKK